MFNIYLDDGTIDQSQLDDICYIVTKNGIFLRKKLGIIDSMVKVNSIPNMKESKLSSYGQINIPKIPGDIFGKICKFFLWAYKVHSGEAVVLIYYNQETNKFDIFPTKQQVTGASANYNLHGRSHEGWNLIGSIHSHANFGAFHSSVDNDDELNFDGVHITVGNIVDQYQSIACSVVVNGNRFTYEPQEYIRGIEKVTIQQNDKQHNTQQGTLFNFNSNQQTNNKSKNVNNVSRYYIIAMENATFDENWKELVQKRINRAVYKNNTKITNNNINNNNRFYRTSIPQGQFNNDVFSDFSDLESFMEKYDYSKDTFDDDFLVYECPCDRCIYKEQKSIKLLEEMLDDYSSVVDGDDFNDLNQGGDNFND